MHWHYSLVGGLRHAQSFNICHLDFTLENLRVARDGRVVLSEFSSCKRFKKRSMIVPYAQVLTTLTPTVPVRVMLCIVLHLRVVL